MSKKTEKQPTLNHDFLYGKEAELNALIARFTAAHEAAHQEILAMDGRQSLGAGKVRVRFRVVGKSRAR